MEQLRRAWQEVDQPLGAEMLVNADFGEGNKAWNLEAPLPAEATLQVVPGWSASRA